MKFFRVLTYLLGGRLLRDFRSLVRNRLGCSPSLLFFAGSQIDLKWILPTYRLGIERGIRCAIVGPNLVLPPEVSYLDATAHALRFMRTKIMATATTGLTPWKMPRVSSRNVAIPHSLVSFHMVYPPGTFDGYTDIFCSGVHHVNEILQMNRHGGVKKRRPVLIGYEDGGLHRKQWEDVPELCKGHVLLGPSWAPGNILEAMGEELIEALLANGYAVTLRPHPAFFISGDPLVTRIVDRFTREKGFVLEESTQESNALWSADVLIADYSGFALEFAFIRERPVLYVDVPPKELNAGWRDLGLEPLEIAARRALGVLVPPRVDEVMSGVARLVGSPERWGGEIKRLRAQYWVNYGRFAEAAIVEFQAMLDESDSGH
jgi:hypothetical protein